MPATKWVEFEHSQRAHIVDRRNAPLLKRTLCGRSISGRPLDDTSDLQICAVCAAANRKHARKCRQSQHKPDLLSLSAQELSDEFDRLCAETERVLKDRTVTRSHLQIKIPALQAQKHAVMDALKRQLRARVEGVQQEQPAEGEWMRLRGVVNDHVVCVDTDGTEYMYDGAMLLIGPMSHDPVGSQGKPYALRGGFRLGYVSHSQHKDGDTPQADVPDANYELIGVENGGAAIAHPDGTTHYYQATGNAPVPDEHEPTHWHMNILMFKDDDLDSVVTRKKDPASEHCEIEESALRKLLDKLQHFRNDARLFRYLLEEQRKRDQPTTQVWTHAGNPRHEDADDA